MVDVEFINNLIKVEIVNALKVFQPTQEAKRLYLTYEEAMAKSNQNSPNKPFVVLNWEDGNPSSSVDSMVDYQLLAMYILIPNVSDDPKLTIPTINLAKSIFFKKIFPKMHELRRNNPLQFRFKDSYRYIVESGALEKSYGISVEFTFSAPVSLVINPEDYV